MKKIEADIEEETSIHKLYQIGHKRLIGFVKEELEPYDFNRGEFPLLFSLIKKGDGVTQKEIREMLPISKATVSKIVKSLEEKGYLRKEKDREDKRATRIFLTEKREEMEDIIEEIDGKAEDVMLKGFDEEEIDQFREYLKRMIKNIEKEG